MTYNIRHGILILLAAILLACPILSLTNGGRITTSGDGQSGVEIDIGNAPYPPSPVITGVEWADANTIVRKANGSDNWPITWADDDNLYTAYGDGWGFVPQTPSKLSLGFANVLGPPDDFYGVNIRSDDEQLGGGKIGKKASGLLMNEGTLYMWVRNADNAGNKCQLAWSTDHAQTWTWSSWKFAEFGYCTFINFGKNYAGARDNYMYVVTHDGPSAYVPADQFILMRVPKSQIRERNAFEFFKQFDGNDNPVWTSNINQRGGIFTHKGLSLRSSISYNAALDRYLWWQQIPASGVDTRYEGGFGIYDSPEPWGPWTTVYFTENWDVGPGENASFPTKWVSSDGRTMYLAFSGDDAFSIRRVSLTIKATIDLPFKQFLPIILSMPYFCMVRAYSGNNYWPDQLGYQRHL